MLFCCCLFLYIHHFDRGLHFYLRYSSIFNCFPGFRLRCRTLERSASASIAPSPFRLLSIPKYDRSIISPGCASLQEDCSKTTLVFRWLDMSGEIGPALSPMIIYKLSDGVRVSNLSDHSHTSWWLESGISKEGGGSISVFPCQSGIILWSASCPTTSLMRNLKGALVNYF